MIEYLTLLYFNFSLYLYALLLILGITLSNQLRALDRILENVAAMETSVAELNTFVTALGMGLKFSQRTQRKEICRI